MLFEIYMALENAGMSAFWDEVSSQYAYVPQHLTECFVKQCKINVENEACKKLIAAKPIIATKFMTRVSRSDTYGGRNLQVHLPCTRSFYQMVMGSSAQTKRPRRLPKSSEKYF